MMEARETYAHRKVHCLLMHLVATLDSKTAAQEIEILQRLIASHYPRTIPKFKFFVKLNGEFVPCRFAKLPPDIPHVQKKGVYHINALAMPDHLWEVEGKQIC